MKRMTEQEVKEKIARRLHTFERNILKIIYEMSPLNVSWSELTNAQREKFRKDASQFVDDFKQAGYVRLAEEGLPKNPYDNENESLLWLIHNNAQQDMLNNNFRKIEKEDS